jgi:predicted pyridoxine 5'-phosphate oxidase superfamily flavin-nucleotide-binding protein
MTGDDDGPFHDGELALQDRVGVKDKVAHFGRRGIRAFMPDEHREFFEQLPFVLVATLDPGGQPWASMAWGLPGFIESPDPTTLHVVGSFAPGDPAVRNLAAGAPVGLLGIELQTRRRNRANGLVTARDGDAFTLHVTQTFGNCKKYIQVRHATFRRDPSAPFATEPVRESAQLSPEGARMVTSADTFFIASRSTHPALGSHGEGVDVSHRGGLPGFAIPGTGTGTGAPTIITFPDYVGNFLFNTLGNIQLDPRVGLLFVDFTRGDLLALAGRAEIVWDGPEVDAVDGAQRLVRVTVDSGVRMPDALPFAFGPPSFAREFGSAGHHMDHVTDAHLAPLHDAAVHSA